MTDEQKRDLNERLCEALEPKPNGAGDGHAREWWCWDLVDQEWRARDLSYGNETCKLINAMRARDIGIESIEEYGVDRHVLVTLYRVENGAATLYQGEDAHLPTAFAVAAARALGLECPA
jgi:hypothetical protein